MIDQYPEQEYSTLSRILGTGLVFLARAGWMQFLWASERSGFKHLFLARIGDAELTPLTPCAEAWQVQPLPQLLSYTFSHT